MSYYHHFSICERGKIEELNKLGFSTRARCYHRAENAQKQPNYQDARLPLSRDTGVSEIAIWV